MKPIRTRSAISWLLSSIMIVFCTAKHDHQAGLHQAGLHQAGLQVERYLEYGHLSVPTEVKRHSLAFPSVTVCINSWINKKSEACLKTPRLCTKFSQEMTWGIFRAQYEPEMRSLVGYQPKEIFECRMESTSPECQSFDCVDHIRTTFLRLPIMLCYTLDSTLYGGSNNMLQKCATPWLYELRIRLRFIERNTLRLMATLPLPVFVQRPKLCQPERNAAIALVPQQSYDIAIKQQTKRRLPSPFTSRCKDYDSEGVKEEFYGIQSKESCTQVCLMKKETELCRCHMSDHEYSATFKGRLCDVVEGKDCWKASYEANIFESCMDQCQPSCEDITYDSRVTGIRSIPKSNGSKETAYELTVRFATDILEMVTEQPALNVIEVFGYVGGYLGIWLGFSLLQVLEYYHNLVRRKCANIRWFSRNEQVKAAAAPGHADREGTVKRIFAISSAELK